jgi:hypothetical protein
MGDVASVDKEALRSAHMSASDEFEKTKSPVAEEVLRRIGRLSCSPMTWMDLDVRYP